MCIDGYDCLRGETDTSLLTCRQLPGPGEEFRTANANLRTLETRRFEKSLRAERHDAEAVWILRPAVAATDDEPSTQPHVY